MIMVINNDLLVIIDENVIRVNLDFICVAEDRRKLFQWHGFGLWDPEPVDSGTNGENTDKDLEDRGQISVWHS